MTSCEDFDALDDAMFGRVLKPAEEMRPAGYVNAFGRVVDENGLPIGRERVNAFGRTVSEADLDALDDAVFGPVPKTARQADPITSLDEAMDIISAGAFDRLPPSSARLQEAHDYCNRTTAARGETQAGAAHTDSRKESARVAEAREAVVLAAIERDRRVIHGADEAMRRRIGEAAARGVVESLTEWAMRDAWTEGELVAMIHERAAKIRAEAVGVRRLPSKTPPKPAATSRESRRQMLREVGIRFDSG